VESKLLSIFKNRKNAHKKQAAASLKVCPDPQLYKQIRPHDYEIQLQPDLPADLPQYVV